ncbi:MAG: Antitoxin [Candidatus Acidoferrum typicum]|nr:Antitoxin [Candidatus Acidoferrum typicum]
MLKVGLFEAKRKLSELVERAGRGERIGITKRGRLAAVIGPAQQEQVDLNTVCTDGRNSEALEKTHKCQC